MKKIISLVGTLILFVCCITTEPKEKNLEVRISIIDKLNADKFNGDKGIFYSIEIDLINNTDTTISFWSMSCDWERNWMPNTNTFYLYPRDCLSNYPHITQVESNKKITFKGIVCFESIEEPSNTNYRLGFTLIRAKEVENISCFNQLLHSKKERKIDLIWSEPFIPR